MMNRYGVGADTEVFAVDNDGIYRSLIGKLGGSKTSPRKTEFGWVQEDNVTGEFNIPPAYTEDEFVTHIQNVMGDLSNILKPLDLSIDISPAALFSRDELQHELAMIAGCDPDYDPWNMSINIPPELEETNMRSCGGHIHISSEEFFGDNIDRRVQFAKVMDLTAGIPSILLDQDKARRELYGKAGAHRPKFVGEDVYDGIEYRSLSNFWLRTEELTRWAYSTVSQAMERFDEFDELIKEGAITSKMVTRTINTSDVKAAEKFCKTFKVMDV